MKATPLLAREALRPSRSAFTLAELVIAAASSTVLMAGMASAIFVASRAVDEGALQSTRTAQAARTLAEMARDLEHATAFSNRAASDVTFVVPDRDGDGAAETLRYFWSGIAGEPLQTKYNSGGAAVVANNFHGFNLTYRTRSVIGTGYVKGVIEDPALVAFWGFEDGSGSKAFDWSRQENNADLLNAPTWTTGRNGGGLSFDGVNDYLNVPYKASLALGANLTVAAWVRIPAGAFGGIRVIVNKGTTANVNNYVLAVSDGHPAFGWLNGAQYQFIAPGVLAADRWYHLAATLAPDAVGRRVRLYTDGVEVRNQTTTNIPPNNAEGLNIGRYQYGGYLSGKLDDIRIYNRTLSGTEIAQVYNGTL